MLKYKLTQSSWAYHKSPHKKPRVKQKCRNFFEVYLIFIMTRVHCDMWGIFWSINFDHFKIPLFLKMNRHFCFFLGFYARVHGKGQWD